MAEPIVIAGSIVVGAVSGAALERLAALFTCSVPSCGRRIGWSALFGAAVGAMLAVSAPARAELAVEAALLAVMFVAALTDLQTRRIPNALSGGGLVLVVAATALFEPRFVLERLLFALLLFAFLLSAALLRPGGLGIGDVKLGAVVGAAFGAASIIALLLAFVAAATVGAAIALRLGWRQGRAATLPLAPFLAAGSLVTVVICG